MERSEDHYFTKNLIKKYFLLLDTQFCTLKIGYFQKLTLDKGYGKYIFRPVIIDFECFHFSKSSGQRQRQRGVSVKSPDSPVFKNLNIFRFNVAFGAILVLDRQHYICNDAAPVSSGSRIHC